MGSRNVRSPERESVVLVEVVMRVIWRLVPVSAGSRRRGREEFERTCLPR